jgi:hypothetical protein
MLQQNPIEYTEKEILNSQKLTQYLVYFFDKLFSSNFQKVTRMIKKHSFMELFKCYSTHKIMKRKLLVNHKCQHQEGIVTQRVKFLSSELKFDNNS